MKKEDAALLWEENAEAWTQLARMGYDIYRDGCNTPAFLNMLPSVKGLKGLDVGCGEGENTRLVAQLGADMAGIDVSKTFIGHAKNFSADGEGSLPRIAYVVASADKIPFAAQYFDFVISTMVLMDIENIQGALKEVNRILKPRGFFQFSIVHPCFQTPGMKWVVDGDGNRAGVEASRYFEEGRIDDEWTFSSAPAEISSGFKPFRVAHFHRTLTTWINLMSSNGFMLEALQEPTPDAASIEKYPPLKCMLDVPLFLHMRVRKS